MTDHTHDTAEEQGFGFWLFLMSDAVVFSLLFATYAVMVQSTDGGPAGPELFSFWKTVIYTFLLLTSSLTFGFATIASRAGRTGGFVLWTAASFALGAAFLAIEIDEFRTMIAQGAGPDRSGFLSAYSALIGTHGLHVAVGLLWMIVAAVRAVWRSIDGATAANIERLAMFWHLVGLVWVVIYSVVFLPGLAA